MIKVHIEYRKLKTRTRPYLYFRLNGKRHREKLNYWLDKKSADYVQVKQIVEDLRYEREKQLNQKTTRLRYDISFKQYFKEFIDNSRIKGIGKYDSAFNFIDHFEDKMIANITVSECQDFLDWLYLEYSIVYANTVIACYKRVFNKAVSDKMIDENPAKVLRMKTEGDDLTKQVLNEQEIRLIYANISHVVHASFVWACYTGMGRAELVAMDASNIVGNILTFRRSKTRTRVVVKVSDKLIKLAKDWDYFAKHPSAHAEKFQLEAICKKVGIKKKITFYCGRHSFAVNLLIAGLDLEQVKNLMGHKDITRTSIYLKYFRSISQESTELLEGL